MMSCKRRGGLLEDKSAVPVDFDLYPLFPDWLFNYIDLAAEDRGEATFEFF